MFYRSRRFTGVADLLDCLTLEATSHDVSLLLSASGICSGMSASSSRTNLSIGLTKLVLAFVLILTLLTSPSGPGYTSITRARGHTFLGVDSLATKTISPSLTFLLGLVHFCLCCNCGKYSAFHLRKINLQDIALASIYAWRIDLICQ